MDNELKLGKNCNLKFVLPQRLKSMFFEEKNSQSAGPFGAALLEKISKNVDFSH